MIKDFCKTCEKKEFFDICDGTCIWYFIELFLCFYLLAKGKTKPEIAKTHSFVKLIYHCLNKKHFLARLKMSPGCRHVTINSTTSKVNKKPNNVKVKVSSITNNYTKIHVLSNVLGFLFANEFTLECFLLLLSYKLHVLKTKLCNLDSYNAH